MPIFEYKCPDCQLLSEKLVLGSAAAPATVTCPRCKGVAAKKEFSSFAMARSGMDNAPIDNAIGKDAELRWTDINRRQEARNKVRQDTGTTGLTMVGRNDFAPLTETQKELRTSLSEAVEASGGFKNSDPVPGRP
jgi:putative FmdB family regulatory protein